MSLQFRAMVSALLLLVPLLVQADQVTPSDRVTTRLHIRETLSSSSSIVG
jgi:hypothetical protein